MQRTCLPAPGHVQNAMSMWLLYSTGVFRLLCTVFAELGGLRYICKHLSSLMFYISLYSHTLPVANDYREYVPHVLFPEVLGKGAHDGSFVSGNGKA